MADPARLPIRTVTELTGVHPVTLRAWERRYGLIQPLRTPKGHRLYTQAHVELIQRVLALTSRGVPIGQVRAALEAETPEADTGSDAGVWPAYRRRALAAVAEFDEHALEAVYQEALSLHAIDRVTQLLLMPLLEALGARWERVAGGIAEEHFFSTYLRNKLGARFHHRGARVSGPRLMAACAPGEHHEIGLLLFALAAHHAGLRVVLLGADVPLAETAAAARRAQCDAVVLSLSIAPQADAFFAALAELAAALARPVYVGGAGAAAHARALAAAGAVPLGAAIDAGVKRIAIEIARRKEEL